MYRVTTPVPGYSGAVGGVHFANGVAVIDEATHPAELAYCRAQGYGVEKLVDEAEPELVDETGSAPAGPEMPKKTASTDAWRAFAKESGMPAEQADAMGRDQLVEHYTKEASQ